MVVMGTRPEAIKLCPVIRELRSRRRWEVEVLSTGQHRAMLESALSAFAVTPNFDLGVMRRNQTLSELGARILDGTEAILRIRRPSVVMVQGDTSSAYFAALAAFYRGIPIAHVEAGLRTYRMDAPFPEELHRRAISLIAKYHFAPTEEARRNLLNEGVPPSSVTVTGNTVVDALQYTLSQKLPSDLPTLPKNTRLLLFTSHRRETQGEELNGMLRALRRIVECNEDVVAFVPVHRSPAVRAATLEILKGAPRIRLIEPLAFATFHHLLSRASLVLTDSGGVQEEAVALGIPTLVLRDHTERAEGIRAGVLRLVGTQEEEIFTVANRLLARNSQEYEAMRKPSGVFGDGFAGVRIADMLERVI
jgi:UDP-N-acetylglucosamine 2-epimerase (non-hydrolysing)